MVRRQDHWRKPNGGGYYGGIKEGPSNRAVSILFYGGILVLCVLALGWLF